MSKKIITNFHPRPFAPLHGTQGPLALSALQLRSFGSSLQLLSILDSMSLFFSINDSCNLLKINKLL
ncbi:unnamed protein product [Rhizophagus irregularis]|nr:unnamed protein product [Rhizophagus irregularis]